MRKIPRPARVEVSPLVQQLKTKGLPFGYGITLLYINTRPLPKKVFVVDDLSGYDREAIPLPDSPLPGVFITVTPLCRDRVINVLSSPAYDLHKQSIESLVHYLWDALTIE